jgi:hypothetical protein
VYSKKPPPENFVMTLLKVPELDGADVFKKPFD